MSKKSVVVDVILILVFAAASSSAQDSIDLRPLPISNKSLEQADSILRENNIPYKLEIEKVSDAKAKMIRVLKVKEGPGPHWPQFWLGRDETLTVFVSVPSGILTDSLAILAHNLATLTESLTALNDTLKILEASAVGAQEKDEEIRNLRDKIRSLYGSLYGRFTVRILVVVFLLFVTVLLAIFLIPKKMGQAIIKGLGSNQLSRRATLDSQAVVSMLRRQGDQIAKLENYIDSIRSEPPWAMKLHEVENHIELRQRRFKEEIEEDIRQLLADTAPKLVAISPVRGELQTTEAYNRALLSSDKDKQSRFIEARRAIAAVPRGELAEKGYMAHGGAEYLLEERLGGSFLIFQEEAKYHVFPNFNIDILSRYVSSAFNMRLDESPGPGNWRVVYPAEVEKIREGLWRLTKLGEIGGTNSTEDRLEATQYISKRISVVSEELDMVKEDIAQLKAANAAIGTELSEEDLVRLYTLVLERWDSTKFSDFAEKRTTKDVKERKGGRTMTDRQKQKSEREEQKTGKEEAKKSMSVVDKPVLEMVQYNEQLKADALAQKDFMEKCSAIQVVANTRGNKVRYKAQKGGNLFLIGNQALPGEYFVFPAFAADPKSVDTTFAGGKKAMSDWRIKRPAKCREISNDEWLLTAKGEIVSD